MKAQRLLLALVAALLCLPASTGFAVSSSTKSLVLYLNSTEAYVNLKPVKLESPPEVVNGTTFVPVKFLSDYLDIPISVDAKAGTISMQVSKSKIVVNKKAKTLTQDGAKLPYNQHLHFDQSGRMLVKLTWITDVLKAKYTYDNVQKKIEIIHLADPAGVVTDAGLSRPVAQFTFGKPTYRVGEKIKIIDWSYDPDGENIARKWTGRPDQAPFQDVFFEPGTYTIGLTVVDQSGNESRPYEQEITITDDVLLTKDQFPFYNEPEGSVFMPNNLSALKDLPLLSRNTLPDTSRKLLVSDSPELIDTKGILYQDQVNGKARLYANHQNVLKDNLQFAILVTNETDEEVRIVTTNKGEVYPTPYPSLAGTVAAGHFLIDGQDDDLMIVKPHDTVMYAKFPDFRPQYGINAMYDVETNGNVTFTFIAMDTNATVDDYLRGLYPHLPYDKHIRGTFPSSELNVKVKLNNGVLTSAARLPLVDPGFDTILQGYDSMGMREAKNTGNYGVTYRIEIENPPKMAVLMRPRAGGFKGAFKINGEFVLAPSSGIITPQSGVQLLKRMTGDERTLTIEFIPPAGSYLPIDLIFYPLNELK